MFAITSILNSDNPHVFFTIKEMVNCFIDVNREFIWYIYITNNNPSKRYLNDSINEFRKASIKIVKEEVGFENYKHIYQLAVEKTLSYDYVMHVDLNYVYLPYQFSGVFRDWFNNSINFLKDMKYDVVYLENSKTKKECQNPFIENDFSIQRREVTLTFNNTSYIAKNEKVYCQPHIRTRETSTVLRNLINKSDVYSIFTLKSALLENGVFGDVTEWSEELERMSYGPYKYDNTNYNINCHVPVLLFSVDKIIHTTIDHDHIRPIYYCWKTDLPKEVNIKNVKRLIKKYNPRVIISCDNDNLTVKELSLPFEYRKRWIKTENIKTIPLDLIENVMMNGIFSHPNDLSNPLITVITCTYESKNRIFKPFYSLLNQSYNNWEWIIIDDSHTDDTWKTLQNFAEDDYRIKIYKGPKNDGSIGKNKQFCGNLATGRFIFELDHDDDIDPDCFQLTLDAAEKYPDAGFFYSDSSEIMEDTLTSFNYGEYYGLGFGSYYMRWWKNGFQYTSMTPKPNPHTIRHIVGTPNHFRCWTRQAYIDVGGHNHNLQVTDDYELIVKTFLKYKFCHIPEQLYIQYRNSGGDNFTFHRNSLIQYYSHVVTKFYNDKIKQRFEELGVTDNVYNGKLGYDKADWEIDYYEYKPIHYTYNPRSEPDYPLITVILPVYKDNIEGLEATMDSVFNQTYCNFELIIVGNKCQKLNDFMNSYRHREDLRIRWVNLFKRYEDDCITLRNYGIKMLSSSEWIGYIDQGILWDTTYLGDAIKEIKKGGVSMIISDVSSGTSSDALIPSHNRIVHTIDLCYRYGLWKKNSLSSNDFYMMDFIDNISHRVICSD